MSCSSRSLITALAVVAGACSSPAPEYAGIGPYSVKRTKLKSALGRCEPTDLDDGRKATWCFANPQLHVAGRPAAVDLYFLGATPDAPLIEIQLQVRGCKEDALSLWLRKSFGEPVEDRGTWASWSNGSVFVIGELPSDPGRCMVRVLPRSEQAEFDRLRAKAQPK
jgi:hypothetical protein